MDADCITGAEQSLTEMRNSAQPDVLHLLVSSPSLFSDMGVQQPVTAILILKLLLGARQLTWYTLCHRRGCGQTANTISGSLSNQQIVKHFLKEASVSTVLPKKAKGSQPLSQAQSLALASLPWDLAAHVPAKRQLLLWAAI